MLEVFSQGIHDVQAICRLSVEAPAQRHTIINKPALCSFNPAHYPPARRLACYSKTDAPVILPRKGRECALGRGNDRKQRTTFAARTKGHVESIIVVFCAREHGFMCYRPLRLREPCQVGPSSSLTLPVQRIVPRDLAGLYHQLVLPCRPGRGVAASTGQALAGTVPWTVPTPILHGVITAGRKDSGERARMGGEGIVVCTDQSRCS